jgi:sugar O-acyltransferase (sialic acid O-acetyltransferase NeuD family)
VIRQAIIIGTGGHCRAILSVLTALGKHEMMGIVDLAKPSVGEVIMGVPVIGSSNYLEEIHGREDIDVFLAIGDNVLRLTWWQKVGDLNLAMPNLISPNAIVDSHAQLGNANVVCARAFIGPEVVLGDNNLVNTAAVLEHEVRIGSNCHLAPSSTVSGRSQIGDDCFVGAGATVINYVEVTAGVTIGAGATVIRSITDSGVYVGTPVRKVGL